MNAILTFIKKNLRDCIIFGTAAVVSIVLLSVFLAWTVKGDKEMTVQVRSASIVSETELDTEYLVRQPFSAEGASLDIGGELIPIEDCGVNADFSSAGEKTVEIVYRKNDYLSYMAKFKVNVLFVRSIEIKSFPDKVTVEDGVATPDEKLEVYATLAQNPATDKFGTAEATKTGYRVKLDGSSYTMTCVQDTALGSFYTLSFFCGDVSTGFSFYNAAGKSYKVSSTKDVVIYDALEQQESALADDGSSLTLIVTERSDEYQLDSNGVTKGYYVYRNAEGTETEYAFDYALEDVKSASTGVTVTQENLKSADIAEENTGDAYTAEIDGHKFTAEAAIWQSAVVNGLIFDDNGYKLVIGSDKRILHFDYIPKDEGAVWQAAGDATPYPTLSLYIMEYDMNPLLGTGNGYSRGVYIYTDRSGVSYKIPFFMQAWVWTFVPLSSTHGDVYSDVSVNDIVKRMDDQGNWQYNTFHRGDLYSDVVMFDRTLGFVTDNFVAAEELWLNAIMGM